MHLRRNKNKSRGSSRRRRRRRLKGKEEVQNGLLPLVLLIMFVV